MTQGEFNKLEVGSVLQDGSDSRVVVFTIEDEGIYVLWDGGLNGNDDPVYWLPYDYWFRYYEYFKVVLI